MAGIAFESEPAMFWDSPSGKLPVLIHEGRIISDSDRMLAYAAERWGTDLDDWLSPRQRARADAIRAMLEHGIHFTVMAVKFGSPENLAGVRAWLAESVAPHQLDEVMAAQVRHIKRKLAAQGLSERTPEEIDALIERWIDALADTLGDKAFLFGDRPTTADATAYAYLIKTLRDFVVGPYKPRIRSHPNLMAYIARLDERYWPEVLAATTRAQAAPVAVKGDEALLAGHHPCAC
jgi:glutathione S-transferase